MRILDPFAGTGKIHKLDHAETIGIEIEPEWASCHPRTLCGDATRLPFPNDSFDAVFSSACYGNRLSDHHNARDGSKRYSYKFALGRNPHENSAATLPFGDAYRSLHRAAIAEMARVIVPGGLCVINMSDHIRKKVRVPVVAWWIEALCSSGFELERVLPVATRRLKYGANAQARVPFEHIIETRRLG
jgi:tRNA G10  N-methylase Trm11